MRRIFTLLFFIILISRTGANAQSACPTATCPTAITENFNLDAGSFTGSAGFTYKGSLGRFEANSSQSNSNTPIQTLVSGDYAGSSPAVLGFTSSGVNGTYTINVRNATTDAIIATCFYAVTGTTTGCVSITNAGINVGSVYFELIFNNVNGSNGAGLLTFDDFRTNLGEAGALPVTFISFDAKKLTAGTQLTWKVGTESNVKLYEIEKNINGAGFTKVGFVTATGASSYSFTDQQPSEGTVLYRVRNVDLDGRFKYSTTINFRNGTASTLLKAFPLPARNLITVQHATAGNNAKINIAAPDGRNIKTLLPSQGAIQTDINLTGLKAGIYILRFASGNGSIETLKIVKQ